MNTRFPTKLAAAFAALCLLAAASDAAIMSKEERVNALAVARSLVNRGVEPVKPERLVSAPAPFNRNLGIQAAASVETGPAKSVAIDPAELLPRLATELNPTGIFVFGGEYYLVFKEKKVKAGSEIAIPYKNDEYTVVISDIKHTSYSVRYGGSELQLKLK